jgi:hypothetical protein
MKKTLLNHIRRPAMTQVLSMLAFLPFLSSTTPAQPQQQNQAAAQPIMLEVDASEAP